MSDASIPPTKRCTKCGEVNPFDEFNKDKSRKDGLQCWCRSCVRQWYKDNADERSKYNSQWYKDNADERRMRISQYNKDHADEKSKYDSQWSKDNRDKQNATSQRRKARKLELPVAFTDDDWRTCLDYWNNRCAVCDRPPGLWHRIAADHWIPLKPQYKLHKPNPGTVPTNIVPLCHGAGGCNNGKGSKDAEQWLTQKFGPRRAKAILKRVQDYFEWIRSRE